MNDSYSMSTKERKARSKLKQDYINALIDSSADAIGSDPKKDHIKKVLEAFYKDSLKRVYLEQLDTIMKGSTNYRI
jgi:hypothetical protein